jgi:hypothetical protein
MLENTEGVIKNGQFRKTRQHKAHKTRKNKTNTKRWKLLLTKIGDTTVIVISELHFCFIFLIHVLSSVMSVAISAWRRCSVRLYFQLFVWVFMSYLRYLCLLAYSGFQHILCCVFVLFFLVLCALCCQVFLNCPFFITPHRLHAEIATDITELRTCIKKIKQKCSSEITITVVSPIFVSSNFHLYISSFWYMLIILFLLKLINNT